MIELRALFRQYIRTYTRRSILTHRAQGSECKMEILGLVAQESGGEVDIVDPTNVSKNFATILEDEVFACDCELKMLLHRGMVLVDPDFDGLSVAQKTVGNITALSNVSFEFRVRTDADAEVCLLFFLLFFVVFFVSSLFNNLSSRVLLFLCFLWRE